MIKGFRQIASITMLSRILGMLRDMAFSFFFGASGWMDGWAIAFKIPNLARRLFGEGAAASSLVPVYSEELQRDQKDAQKLASTVVSVILVLLTVVVLIGEIGIWAWYAFIDPDAKLALSGIMLPYMILICVVAILAGILNAHRHFAIPAAAPIVLNLFIIGSLCFSGWVINMEPASQVFFVAVAVVIAGFVQLIMQIPPLRARGIHIRPAWQVKSDAFRKVILLMGPMVLGLTATQINTLADDLIACWLSGSPEKGDIFTFFSNQIKYPLYEGAVSQLYYAQRLYQLPLGVLGISLATAVFPVMSEHAARKDFNALKETIAKGLNCAVFVALPATLGLILVGRTLVAALFEHGKFNAADTRAVAITLCFYAVGLSGFFAQQIVTRAFYSTKESKIPAKSAAIAVALNIVLNLTLIWSMGTAGLALSTAICSYLQVAILLTVLIRRYGKPLIAGLVQTIIKSIIASTIMALVMVAILWKMESLGTSRTLNVIRLIVVVPTAAAVYTLAAKILAIKALSLLTGQKNVR
jgi:putative peptidoglycan lipid II flippase